MKRVWLKLNSVFFGLEQDLYIGIWYNPLHDTSRVHKVHELWSAIENKITLLQEREDVIIMGDLNARTGTKQDWAEYNNIRTFPLPKDFDDDYKIGMRVLMDRIVNSAGQILLDVCISTALRILNGCHGNDSDTEVHL